MPKRAAYEAWHGSCHNASFIIYAWLTWIEKKQDVFNVENELISHICCSRKMGFNHFIKLPKMSPGPVSDSFTIPARTEPMDDFFHVCQYHVQMVLCTVWQFMTCNSSYETNIQLNSTLYFIFFYHSKHWKCEVEWLGQHLCIAWQ